MSHLSLVSVRPPERIKEAWIEGTSLNHFGPPIVDFAPHLGPYAYVRTQRYRDKKGKEYYTLHRFVQVRSGDVVHPRSELEEMPYG